METPFVRFGSMIALCPGTRKGISDFGAISLPILATFHFRFWRYFTSGFGDLLSPNAVARVA